MLYLIPALSQGFVAAPAAGKAVAPRVSGANMAALAEEYLIAPSILSADFANLGKEVADVLEAGADTVHFDVMDNHYVPNLTIGPMVCKALKNYGIKAPIDVHMMVSPVDQLINDFADAGADYITFHPEATQHIDRSLQLVRSRGCKSGLVFNPGTPLDCLKYVMDKVDIVLLMSVNPGFGGQSFIPGALLPEPWQASRSRVGWLAPNRPCLANRCASAAPPHPCRCRFRAGTLDKLKEARALINESGYPISLQVRTGGSGVADGHGDPDRECARPSSHSAVSLCNLGSHLQPCASAALRTPTTG